MRDAFVAACQRDAKPFAEKWRLPEDLERLRRQDHCKMLKIALRVYAKQKNIPPAELEIMELKEYTRFREHGKVYGHYNFVVKDSDGTLTLFFAEVDINCKEEKDVFLCCRLEANDNGGSYVFPQIPSDGNPDDDAEGALATRPHRRPSTASSAATSLAVFAVAKLIDRVTSTALVDPRLALALALALAICQRIQERSVTVYVTLDSSCRRKHCDFSEGDFAGLQIEDDPTPRLLSRYISDTGLYVTLMATYKSGVFPSSYEILFPEQQEEACKMVEIALHAYAKQKDMPPAKLEIMKVKERSLFEECGKVYAHFNFLVINDSDGTRTLFFAEVDFLNCKEEKDVYLCCPLEENDNGRFLIVAASTRASSEDEFNKLRDAFVAASKRHMRPLTLPKEMEVLKGKRDVKIAKIALHAYAKQNNIPAAELEFVELKGSSFFFMKEQAILMDLNSVPGSDSDTSIPKIDDDSGGEYVGLQPLDNRDSTRSSPYKNDQELADAFIAACERYAKPFAEKWRLPEDLEKRKRQDECKMLKIPLRPAELEIMELKEYTLFDEHGKVYAHYNFVVKDSDGTLTLFFAEVIVLGAKVGSWNLGIPLVLNIWVATVMSAFHT
ncbi:hypothetical protein OsI_34570 [Oryza sativa Indica Group]|uniref:DUF3615 domain-containing protein n=1 Tax=Oryza sativa subsp. indica TaxID=39946 RepID=B8BI51_ORYSI|nr:hypothetical protein OsI_34570 [Oryza sativa Indica Group]